MIVKLITFFFWNELCQNEKAIFLHLTVTQSVPLWPKSCRYDFFSCTKISIQSLCLTQTLFCKTSVLKQKKLHWDELKLKPTKAAQTINSCPIAIRQDVTKKWFWQQCFVPKSGSYWLRRKFYRWKKGSHSVFKSFFAFQKKRQQFGLQGDLRLKKASNSLIKRFHSFEKLG